MTLFMGSFFKLLDPDNLPLSSASHHSFLHSPVLPNERRSASLMCRRYNHLHYKYIYFLSRWVVHGLSAFSLHVITF